MQIIRYTITVGTLLWIVSAAAQTPVQAPAPATPAPTASNNSKLYVNAWRLTGESRYYLQNMGTRLTKPGSESGAYTGTYTDSSGTFPVTMQWQNPGMVRFTIVSPSAQTITYDGSKAAANGSSLTATQQDLLDALTDDYPDAFFFSMGNGAANRLLGTRYRTDNGANPQYKGPFYTIYQKAAPVASTKAGAVKMFVFDESTGLLDRVMYRQGQGANSVEVEVQFSNWQTINGQKFPGKVVRVTPSGTEFTITFPAAAFGPAVPAQSFAAAQ